MKVLTGFEQGEMMMWSIKGVRMRTMNQLSNRLYLLLTTPVLAGAAALFLFFMLTVLPGMAVRTEEMTGSTASPDTSFLYTARDLYEMAEAYGAAGRAFYISTRFTFDIIWPLVYLLFLTAVITALFRPFDRGSPWRKANLLPWGGVTFDFLENMGASVVMHRYPLPTPLIAELTPIFTFIKWLLIAASMAVIVLGILLRLVRHRRYKL